MSRDMKNIYMDLKPTDTSKVPNLEKAMKEAQEVLDKAFKSLVESIDELLEELDNE